MEINIKFKINPPDQGVRLDKFSMARLNSPLTPSLSSGLADKMPEYSRAAQ